MESRVTRRGAPLTLRLSLHNPPAQHSDNVLDYSWSSSYLLSGSPSVSLSFFSFLGLSMFEHKKIKPELINARTDTRTHTDTLSRSTACSSFVFCRLDSHRCLLWLHYCYLNVGGRSAASINGILSTADAAQDTHTYEHKSTHTYAHIWDAHFHAGLVDAPWGPYE